MMGKIKKKRNSDAMQRASSVVNPENLKYSVEVSFVQFEKQTEEYVSNDLFVN